MMRWILWLTPPWILWLTPPWGRVARRRRWTETADHLAEREADTAVRMLLDQAVAMSAGSTARVYISASRDPESPMFTPGQAARGHGGRP